MLDKVVKTIDGLQHIQTYLQKKRAFVLLSVSIGILSLPLYYSALNMGGRTISEIVPNVFHIRNITLVLGSIEACLLIVWLAVRRIPRFSKAEIGILIAVVTEDEKLKIRLRNDFVENLKSEMRVVSKDVSIKVLSEYHCEKIYARPEKALLLRYHYLSGAKLIVFGNADTRSHLGQESYHLKLDESASHAPIPQTESDKLSVEMMQSFPRETLIATNNEFFGFRLISAMFGLASKYILGIACLYSRRFDLALQFHSAILRISLGESEKIPNVRRLVEKTKKLVSEEAVLLAREDAITLQNLPRMKQYLDFAAEYDKSVGYYLLMGIYCFASNRDISAAKVSIEEAKRLSPSDYAWAYSMAFLLAYEGKLSEAYQMYRSAFRNGAGPTTHLECEVFIRRILEIEPDKIQLWYCLGLLYLFAHDDRLLAKECFLEFKRQAVQKQRHMDQIQYVDVYLEKIEKKEHFE
jgi:tetratricopeptide (TPR) repeat protein